MTEIPKCKRCGKPLPRIKRSGSNRKMKTCSPECAKAIRDEQLKRFMKAVPWSTKRKARYG